jgi:transposase
MALAQDVQCTQEEAKEENIQQACLALKKKTYQSVHAAAQAFGIPISTLRRRSKGIATSRKQAHEKDKHLNKAQEDVLCEWIAHLAATGHPISKRTIRPKVQALCGKWPSRSWIRQFLKRHPDLCLGRPSGLDPKRAQAFNPAVVRDYFNLLHEYIERHDIPWENIYNMDEKGIQLGGGRRGTQQKFFFSRGEKSRYKVQSGDLELVTVIEVICADGTCDIKPGFVFSGTTMFEEWFCEDEVM